MSKNKKTQLFEISATKIQQNKDQSGLVTSISFVLQNLIYFKD